MTDDSRERIRSLLVKVGDERKKVVGNLRGSVSIMTEDIAEHRDTIMIALIECAKYLPTKSGVYGTWLALMNPDNRVFVSESINSLYNELRYSISDNNLAVSASIVRVLIECANAGCLSIDSIASLIRDIMVVSDCGLYIATSSVCWFSPEIALSNSEVGSLIEEIVAAAESLTSSEAYRNRKAIFSPVQDLSDQLESAIEAIKFMRGNGWESEVLVRPYLMDGLALPVFESEYIHSIPRDNTAIVDALQGKSWIPKVVFRTDDSLNVADRFLLEELMNNTLDLFNMSVGECSKALLRIPFVHPAFESVLSDVVVSNALIARMPGFYQSTMHRVMLLQESVRPAFEATLSAISSRPDVSPDIEFALADLLAFTFVNNIKLSSYEGISSSVCEKFLILALRLVSVNSVQGKLEGSGLRVDSVPEPGQGMPFEASDEYALVREVVRIKDGSDTEVFELLMNRMADKESGFALFVQALLENGSRTITHFTKLLELYKSVILRSLDLGLVSSFEQRELILVSRIFAFWSNNSFRLEKTLDLLIHNDLLRVQAILNALPIDPQSITTYNLIDIIMCHLISRKKHLAKEIEESVVNEALTQQLAEVQYTLSMTAGTLLNNSPDSVQRWIVRRYHADLDKSAIASDVLATMF